MNKNTTTSTSEKNASERNVPFEYENAYEEWSTAGIGNTFLFGKVMTSNPNLLLELLQYSLPEFHIQQIENPEKEADVKLSIDAHGVRLDVITTDDQGRRIDVEMQMRDEKNIPRRMRYYEGSIDQTTLEKGQNYNRLGDVVILFITPFDPFDAHGYYKYTFRNTCQEDKELVLDDGVTKVVLNAAGHKGEITPELIRGRLVCRSRAEAGAYSQTQREMEERVYGLGDDAAQRARERPRRRTERRPRRRTERRPRRRTERRPYGRTG